MARCTRSARLEVHHKVRTGTNELSNTVVLCQQCHEATGSYGSPGASPPEFSQETKAIAKHNAGYQCECTSGATPRRVGALKLSRDASSGAVVCLIG